MKIFNELGMFWIPELGKTEFPGLIEITNGNFYLKSKTDFLEIDKKHVDFLSNIESSNEKSINDTFLIFGIINQSPISLEILPFDFQGMPDIKFKISTIFQNIHLKKLTNINFKKIQCL